MSSTSLFRETFLELEPELLNIVNAVRAVPEQMRPGTAHIDHTSAIMQYVFYVALVRKWVGNARARILDWGGQHGQVTKLLGHFYPDTCCYVLSDDAYDQKYQLETWHRRLGIEHVVRSSNPHQLCLPDGEFDAAISSGVLEHVMECGVDEKEAISELYRTLKQGGLLFIWNLPRLFGRECIYGMLGRPAHARRYRKAEITGILHSSGFDVAYISHHEILPLSALKRLESKMSPYSLIRWDYLFSELMPLLAQNFTIVARKR